MEIVFLLLFLLVVLIWIMRFKKLFLLKDKKKYEKERDDLIDDLMD